MSAQKHADDCNAMNLLDDDPLATTPDDDECDCGAVNDDDAPIETAVLVRPTREGSRFLTFPVAAAAYPRKHDGPFLTHTWDDLKDRVLCRRVKSEHVLVDYALEGQDARPSCEECARRDPRHKDAERFAVADEPNTTAGGAS